MASTESARQLIAEARGILLVLMQEGDSDRGFVNTPWADEMYRAWEELGSALSSIDKAETYV